MIRFKNYNEARRASIERFRHSTPFEVKFEHKFNYELGKSSIRDAGVLPANKYQRMRGAAHRDVMPHLARSVQIDPSFKSITITGLLDITGHSSFPFTDTPTLGSRYEMFGVPVDPLRVGKLYIIVDEHGNYMLHMTSEADEWDAQIDELYEACDIVGAVDMAEKESPIPLGDRGNYLFRTGYASGESSQYNFTANDDLPMEDQPDNEKNIGQMLALEQSRSKWNDDPSWKKRYVAQSALALHLKPIINKAIDDHNALLPPGCPKIPHLNYGTDQERINAFASKNADPNKDGFNFLESGWHGMTEDITGHSLALPNLEDFLKACELSLPFDYNSKEDLATASRCVTPHTDSQNDPGRDHSMTIITAEHAYHMASQRFHRIVSIFTNRNGCRCALLKNKREFQFLEDLRQFINDNPSLSKVSPSTFPD